VNSAIELANGSIGAVIREMVSHSPMTDGGKVLVMILSGKSFLQGVQVIVADLRNLKRQIHPKKKTRKEKAHPEA